MSLELVPYALLLLAILVGWHLDTRISLAVLVGSVIAGLFFERLEPLALVWLGVLFLSIWIPANLQLKGFHRIFCSAVFFVFALLMTSHMLPGFNNFPVFRGIQFSPDSFPFTMYLNFDKAVVGLLIFLLVLKPHQPQFNAKRSLLIAAYALSLLLLLIMPLALAIGYVRFDVKFPELGWLWVINNLFFVCLAEEGLFRGLIQRELSNALPKTKSGSTAALVLTAILFGLAHYKGGMTYVALSTVAGVFYGYAYQKTGRIEAPIAVHFGLNLIHFLLFSYPALVR